MHRKKLFRIKFPTKSPLACMSISSRSRGKRLIILALWFHLKFYLKMSWKFIILLLHPYLFFSYYYNYFLLTLRNICYDFWVYQHFYIITTNVGYRLRKSTRITANLQNTNSVLQNLEIDKSDSRRFVALSVYRLRSQICSVLVWSLYFFNILNC